jgi:nitroreductase
MTITEALETRHSVRQFTEQAIDEKTIAELQKTIDACNKEGHLHLQLCINEPEAFQASKPHYGSFVNCRNYIAAVAKSDQRESCGYYGQKIVLASQMLGLNTCWVVLTYKKGKAVYQCDPDEKLQAVIALGYGITQGTAHKSKEIDKLCTVKGEAPVWFQTGMKAASLAPTAMNQQKFMISLDGNTVSAKPLLSLVGNADIDLGIVKCNFEIGAGKENFHWAER